MTSFAFIFGLMPLWYALGAGAVARRLIGTVTIVGMLFSSGFAIFLVPVLFVIVERLSGGAKAPGEQPSAADEPAERPVPVAERAASGRG
jgi:HAE1 family hydrophobic/amphiphilic exporter-1